MNRYTVALGLVVILSVVLQGALVPYVGLFGGTFNLLVVVVASAGLHYGIGGGLRVGLLTGLLADVILGRVLGFYAVPLVLLGFAAGQLERQVYKDVFLVPVFAGFLATLFFEIVLLLMARFVFGIWWSAAFLEGLLPSVLLNGALMPLAFGAMGRLVETKTLELR